MPNPEDSWTPIPKWNEGGNTSLAGHDTLHEFIENWMQGVQDWLGDEEGGLITDRTKEQTWTPEWAEATQGVLSPGTNFGTYTVDGDWVSFVAQMTISGTGMEEISFTLPTSMKNADIWFTGPAFLRSATPMSATQFNFDAVAGKGDAHPGWVGNALAGLGTNRCVITPPFGFHQNVQIVAVSGRYLKE